MELFDSLNDLHKVDATTHRQLAGSELFYRSLFEHHPDVVFHLDLDGNLIEANGSFYKVLGYEAEEVQGDFRSLLPPDQVEWGNACFDKARQGESLNYHLVARHKDGHPLEFLVTNIPNVVHGTVVGVYGIAKDITENKYLRESYKSLFTHLKDAGFILDLKGHIIDVNEAGMTVGGYAKEELLDKSFIPLIVEEEREKVFGSFQRVLGGDTMTIDCSLFHKDGHVIVLNITAVPINISGRVVGVIGIAKDITEQKLIERVLQESKQRYESLFMHHPDGVAYFDTQGCFVDCNPALERIIGHSKQDLVHSTFNHLIQADDLDKTWSHFALALAGEPQNYAIVCVHKEGHWIDVSVTNLPIVIEGQIVGVYSIAKDITEEKRSERALVEAETKYRSLVEESIVGVYIIQDGIFVYANPRLNWIFGSNGSIEGADAGRFIHPDDLPAVKLDVGNLSKEQDSIHHQFRIMKQNGSVIDVEAHTTRIYYKGRPAVIGTLLDITDRKRSEQLNEYLAYHDALTGLPNRRYFEEKLRQSIAAAKTHNQQLAVMYLDMDRFKYVNDSLGHRMGDKLLKQIGERLAQCVGEGDIIARMGGDEFTIFIPDMKGIESVIRIAERIIKSLNERFEIEEYEFFITVSAGISIFPIDGEEPEALMKNADSALYRAKDQGKNNYQIYTPSMNAQTYRTFTLEKDLRKALRLNQLELYYQPKVDPCSGLIVGVEALIRWNHPEWGLISPNEFIPLAEETGLIAPVNEWVQRSACLQNKAWQLEGLPPIPVSINLSAQHFMQKDVVESVRRVLGETGLQGCFLEIEITESSLLENEEVTSSTIDELKEMGVKIALDDFGTGYSSLSYLKRFKHKIDTLKIDRSFVRDLCEDSDDKEIIRTIIHMAYHLKMSVVAEGVENEEQLSILRSLRCSEIQGYLYSRPVPAKRFAELLAVGRMEPAKLESQPRVVENRRKFVRTELKFPLSAAMTIIQIKGRAIQLGQTEVAIEDIGIGGLRFLSTIKLAVHPEIILQFETEILQRPVTLNGVVVWYCELDENVFQYGVQFSIADKERSAAHRLFNDLAAQLKRQPHEPPYKYITGEKISYLRR